MLLVIIHMCIFLSCIDKSFPKPDIPFLEDENHDKDGDGFSENEGDCDDSNSQIYPGSAQFEPVTSCTPDYDNDGFESSQIREEESKILESKPSVISDDYGDDFEDSMQGSPLKPGESITSTGDDYGDDFE